MKLLGAGGVRVVGVDVEKHTEDRIEEHVKKMVEAVAEMMGVRIGGSSPWIRLWRIRLCRR